MDPDDEGSEEVAGLALNNLRIEMVVSKAEAEEGFELALGMEVEEVEGREGEKEGWGTLRAMEALEILTQEAKPSGTALVDSRNGFNGRLARTDGMPPSCFG